MEPNLFNIIATILAFTISYILPVIDFILNMYDRFKSPKVKIPKTRNTPPLREKNSVLEKNLVFLRQNIPLLLLILSIGLYLANIDFSKATILSIFYSPLWEVGKILIRFLTIFTFSQAILSLFARKNLLKKLIFSVFMLAISYLNNLIYNNIHEFPVSINSTIPFQKGHYAFIILFVFFTVFEATVLLTQLLSNDTMTWDIKNSLYLLIPYLLVFGISFTYAWILSPKSYPFDTISIYLHHLIDTVKSQIPNLKEKTLY